MKFLALVLASSVLASDAEPTDYKTAYNRAQQGDKPLLVLVTAEWCQPCKVMKATTIPQLMEKDAFKDFHYTTVDLGTQEKLARKLIGRRGVPQLIMFEKRDDVWVHRYLRGIQTTDTVEAFIAQANTLRTADASAEVVGK